MTETQKVATTPPAFFGALSAASDIRQTIETELVPRLMLAHRAGPLPPQVLGAIARLDDLQIREFVGAVLAPEDSLASIFVANLRERGITVESVYLDLLAPAARLLGQMWEEDACSFADVTIALGRLQLVLRDLSGLFVRERADSELVGQILLACVPGEQHSLGLFMVAEFFIRDGWGVSVGPPLREADLLADVGATWYDVVGFSVACNSSLDLLKRQIQRVRKASRNPNVHIMAGGRALTEHPELVARIGADGSAENAELAPERARHLLLQS